MRILVVGDDAAMAGLLQDGLKQENHVVTIADDGRSGLELAKHYQFDVIVLDLTNARIDGLKVLRRLRGAGISTPILMLAERDAVPDVVKGLDPDSDDFLAKPFSFGELLARLGALARRTHSPLSKKLHEAGHVRLDLNARCVFSGEREIHLTPTEYRLLEFLMTKQGAAVSRRSIVEAVWGLDADLEENTLDAFVRLLRNKIEVPGKPRLIQTVRGFGYRLQAMEKREPLHTDSTGAEN